MFVDNHDGMSKYCRLGEDELGMSAGLISYFPLCNDLTFTHIWQNRDEMLQLTMNQCRMLNNYKCYTFFTKTAAYESNSKKCESHMRYLRLFVMGVWN